jgi:uncharacterized protein (TIGR03086 family)
LTVTCRLPLVTAPSGSATFLTLVNQRADRVPARLVEILDTEMTSHRSATAGLTPALRASASLPTRGWKRTRATEVDVAADPIDQLVEALELTAAVIEGIDDPQWDLATPCTEWTVRDVVAHLVDGNRRFAALLGTPTTGQGTPDAPGGLVVAYRDSVTALAAAYRRPDALTKVVTVPFGTVPGSVTLQLRLVEALVHGWDLARATRQRVTFPDGIAEAALSFSQAARAQIPPGRNPFGPPQPVADNAAAIDRLAAYLGRPVLDGGRGSGGP